MFNIKRRIKQKKKELISRAEQEITDEQAKELITELPDDMFVELYARSFRLQEGKNRRHTLPIFKHPDAQKRYTEISNRARKTYIDLGEIDTMASSMSKKILPFIDSYNKISDPEKERLALKEIREESMRLLADLRILILVSEAETSPSTNKGGMTTSIEQVSIELPNPGLDLTEIIGIYNTATDQQKINKILQKYSDSIRKFIHKLK